MDSPVPSPATSSSSTTPDRADGAPALADASPAPAGPSPARSDALPPGAAHLSSTPSTPAGTSPALSGTAPAGTASTPASTSPARSDALPPGAAHLSSNPSTPAGTSPALADASPPPTTRSGTDEVLLAELVDQLTARLKDGPARVVVGLTGAPGSGKSTLADRLGQLLAARDCLAGSVPMDGFHMSNAVLDALGRHGRKGAPDTFDVEGYLSVLDRLRAPGSLDVLAPVYRRDLHEPVAAGTRVSGPGVVLTEGNYLALDSCGWKEVRSRVDLLVFLEVPEEELVVRLVARHQDFGRSAADAGHWVRAVDLPNARLVAASASRCDEIWRLTASA